MLPVYSVTYLPGCTGRIFAQRPGSIGIWRVTSTVAPPEVEVERVLAGLETRSRVAGAPYGGFGSCKKGRADPSTEARRRDIKCRNAVSVYPYPGDRHPVHSHPHVMVPNRPRDAICCRSRRPRFGLFHRHRWYGQRENGMTPDTCKRFLVSGFSTPNLHQVASTWPNAPLSGAPKARPLNGKFGASPGGYAVFLDRCHFTTYLFGARSSTES